MDKNILIQYTDLQEEIKDLRNRIDKKEHLISKMEEDGYQVADSVKGGAGGIQHFKIHGYPGQEYDRQKSLLRSSMMTMQLKQERLLEMTTAAEQYIDGIEDSRIRRIFRYRYIDGLTWQQVANRMGGKHTAESCRKYHDRVLEEG